MRYNNFAIEQNKNWLSETAMKKSTPKRLAGHLLEAAEQIAQLQADLKAQVADVQKVRHGKMNMYKPRRMNRNATYNCSVCGKLCSSYYNDVGEWKFCPHCGTKMG